MRIWKYPLEVADGQNLSLPTGAKILTVQMQGGTPCLWALVDEDMPTTETRAIAIYGTGNPMPTEPGAYIATFRLHGSSLLFHAFEYNP